MSRLIDAKGLIQGRPENLNPNMNDEIKSAYNKGWNACNSEWINLIKEQPTAYNTDKVVEQLEAGMQKMCETICVDDGYEQEIYDAYRQGIYDAFTDAIEIVKKGGVA